MTSIIRADNISTVAGTGTIAVQAGNTLDASAGFTPPAGHVIQVIQTVKTDTFTMNSTSYTDVTGFSATITPTSTSNKILIVVDTQVSGSVTYNVKLALVRGTSTYLHTKVQRIAQDGQGQYREYSLGCCYLDSPSTTDATTYKLQMNVNGQPAYLNRPADLAGYTPAGSESNSTITLMEIAG